MVYMVEKMIFKHHEQHNCGRLMQRKQATFLIRVDGQNALWIEGTKKYQRWKKEVKQAGHSVAETWNKR